MGFPIRKSPDQSSFAAPRGLSQRITSFIACACQGIHQLPLRHLIVLIANAHPWVRTASAQKDQLLEIGPVAAVRLANHMREIERLPRQTTPSLSGYRHGVRTNLLFTMSYRTGGRPKPAANFSMRMTAVLSTPGNGGAGRDRTDDPLLAKQVLSQLSYGP